MYEVSPQSHCIVAYMYPCIWAQKHFAYAHNIRYAMLCYINTCRLRIRSTPGVRCTLWPSSRNGGFSPFAIARKYLTR